MDGSQTEEQVAEIQTQTKLNPGRKRAIKFLGGVALAGAFAGGIKNLFGSNQSQDANTEIFSGAYAATAAPTGGKPATPPLMTIALNRLSYGPRASDVEAYKKLAGKTETEKLQAHIEQQLNPSQIDDSACEARLAGFASQNKSLKQLWQEYRVNLKTEGDERYRIMWLPTTETRMAAVLRAVYSKRQVLELVTEFWHNHFNVFPDRDERIVTGFAAYDKHLRDNAFGNFKNILLGVCKSPAMLYYLDNASSNRSGPNENFARELFELHTLGSEHYLGVKRQKDVAGFNKGQPVGYVDDDVYEATRAFTGWRVDDNTDEQGLTNNGAFLAYTPWHDRFQKTVLGKFLSPDQTPEQDGMAVIEALANHPGTAKHIVAKLVQRFVSDDPPQRLVDAATKTFLAARNAPDQIKQVLRLILQSQEFTNTWGEKTKRPFEYFVAVARALNSEFEPQTRMVEHLEWMGQHPFGHHPPDGYSDKKEFWMGASSLLKRWQTAETFCNNDLEHCKTDVVQQTPKSLRTPNQIVDYWLARILLRPVSQTVRSEVMDMLAPDLNPDMPIPEAQLKDRLRRMTSFIFMIPDFAWR